MKLGGVVLCVAGLAGPQAAGTADTALKIETRTLSPVAPQRPGVNLIFNQRIVSGDRMVYLSRTVQPDGSVSYGQREFTLDGTPISSWQEGFWSERWNRFETRFSSTGAEQFINETRHTSELPNHRFRNPTLLWFWKTQPAVGESVVVTYLAQNVIATSQIRYTYEGTEELTLASRTVTVHRVREDPVGAPGVFTIWWYDAQGMGVKRFHKTTQSEFTDVLTAWR